MQTASYRQLMALKYTLIFGAVYDIVFAAAMVLIPEFSAGLLNIRLPGESFYLWLIAVFLCMLAAFYLFAAYDPQAYRGNIQIGIVGRTCGFLVIMYAAYLDPTMPGLYLLAFGDLSIAIATLFFWWPIRHQKP